MAIQAPETRSFSLFSELSRPRIPRELLGWILLAAVTLVLWGWFAAGVVAPLAGAQSGNRAGGAVCEVVEPGLARASTSVRGR